MSSQQERTRASACVVSAGEERTSACVFSAGKDQGQCLCLSAGEERTSACVVSAGEERTSACVSPQERTSVILSEPRHSRLLLRRRCQRPSITLVSSTAPEQAPVQCKFAPPDEGIDGARYHLLGVRLDNNRALADLPVANHHSLLVLPGGTNGGESSRCTSASIAEVLTFRMQRIVVPCQSGAAPKARVPAARKTVGRKVALSIVASNGGRRGRVRRTDGNLVRTQDLCHSQRIFPGGAVRWKGAPRPLV